MARDGGARHRHAPGHARRRSLTELLREQVRPRRRATSRAPSSPSGSRSRCRCIPDMTDADQELVVDGAAAAPSRRASRCAGSRASSTARARPVPRELLQRMSDVIAHRGPDGEGQYADGPVGLGNRRLAIIDPHAARATSRWRPATGDLVITYNGEVYNFRELRAELEARGPPLPLATPTPRSCCTPTQEWGAGVPSSASTACSRSRSGTARSASCSSPATATGSSRSTTPSSATTFAVRLRDQGAARAPRARARGSACPHLLEYFTFQNIFTDGTLFDGVRLLPAGPLHARCRRGRRPASPQRYWDFDFASADDGARPTRSTPRSSTGCSARPCERQLVTDVPVGALPERRDGLGQHHRARRRRRCRT